LSWLRRLVDGLSPRWPWLDPQAGPYGICGRRNGTGTSFSSSRWNFSLSLSLQQLSLFIHQSSMLCSFSTYQPRQMVQFKRHFFSKYSGLTVPISSRCCATPIGDVYPPNKLQKCTPVNKQYVHDNIGKSGKVWNTNASSAACRL